MKRILIPILAFGVEEFKRPVLLYNHASHMAWLGKSIADLVLDIEKDDDVDIEEDDDENDELPVMKVLAPDGSTQMELEGGERIVSRRETKILIKKAKKADKTKNDSDYKALGRYIFKVFKKQDARDPEYVDGPEESK